jgi:hypothetical protein
MYVQKRDGRREAVSFDKITARITKLSYGLHSDFCDPVFFVLFQQPLCYAAQMLTLRDLPSSIIMFYF